MTRQFVRYLKREHNLTPRQFQGLPDDSRILVHSWWLRDRDKEWLHTGSHIIGWLCGILLLAAILRNWSA